MSGLNKIKKLEKGRTLLKGQKCKALIIANVWFSIDVILQELPPVGGHVVGQDNDFFSLSTR